MTDDGFIQHTEKRMHLPELSDVCVDCLTEALVEARREAEELRDRKYMIDWWADYQEDPLDDYKLPWETEFVPRLDEKGRPK